MGWLTGEVVLVTGGGSGLGRALVERFVEEGARVAVLELSAAKVEVLRQDFGGDLVVTQGDATLLQDNHAAVESAVASFGQLDTFVANAALWDFGTSIVNLPEESVSDAFDEVFALNVKAYLLGAKAALPALCASRGSMIFSLSNAAFLPGGGGPLYTASKHAVVGLVKQLAYELAPTVRVNGVAPGGMATDLRGPRALGLDTVSMSAVVEQGALRSFNALDLAPDPGDYAGHYVLLASRKNNRAVTGAIHTCDAGIGVRRFPLPTDSPSHRP